MATMSEKSRVADIYRDTKPIGYYSISAFFGYYFFSPLDFEDCDLICCEVLNGVRNELTYTELTIEYDDDCYNDCGCVNIDSTIVSLNDIVRVHN